MAGAAAQASSSGFWRFTGGEGGKCRRVSPLSACRTEDRLIDTLFLIDCSIFLCGMTGFLSELLRQAYSVLSDL